MNLTDEKIKYLTDIYKDPKKGLGGANALYNAIKREGNQLNITQKNVTDFYKSLEVNQVATARNSTYNSFVATGPLQQFQVDVIYMPKAWFNGGYKYILSCVDVFTKKGDMIPLKERDSTSSTKAMSMILSNLGIPKTIYSDKGSEFNNADFLKLMKKHDIEVIFAIGHAPFVEAFNKTMKNRMYKYMSLYDIDEWYKIIPEVLDGYNSTPHTVTGIAPIDVTEKNSGDVLIKLLKRKKKKTYEDIKEGDQVRVPVINKVQKGYKDQWTYELKPVEKDLHNGLYKVGGQLHARKDLKLVNTTTLIKRPEKPAAEKKQREKVNKVGKAQYDPGLKDLVGRRMTFNEVEKMIDEKRSTRGKAINFRELAGLKK